MRVLFITNDLHDALNSRVKFKKWFEKVDNRYLYIAAPVNLDDNFPEISLKLKNRGFTISNIYSVNNYINSYSFNTIVYRGIENIILSLFIKNSKNTKVIFLLTGLGRLFSDNLVFKKIIRKLYKYILIFCKRKKKAMLIVQNIEDANDLGLSDIEIINGSGFPFKIFKSPKLQFNTPTIITATRLTLSKGLDDILKLSETIVNNKLKIRYYILGDFSHLNHKYISKILDLNKSSNIHFLGFKNNISEYISKSHYAYYPTNYREGAPRFLIEALCNGLVIFTNSMPGCSLMVSNNNGFLNLSIQDLIKKIMKMSDKEFNVHSKNSRDLFETIYSDNVVYPEYFNLIKNYE